LPLFPGNPFYLFSNDLQLIFYGLTQRLGFLFLIKDFSQEQDLFQAVRHGSRFKFNEPAMIVLKSFLNPRTKGRMEDNIRLFSLNYVKGR